jgi:lysophospholipase L1-like esterase
MMEKDLRVSRLHCVWMIAALLLSSAVHLGAQRIIYFGDSITEGWMDGHLEPAYAYPTVTDSLLRTRGWSPRSTNAGRGGETSLDGVFRVDRDVLSRAPDVAVIAFGSNDSYVWGVPAAPRVDSALFARNLRSLTRKILDAGAFALLLGLPPMDESRYYRYVDSLLYVPFGGAADLHARYDAVISHIARETGAAFVRFGFQDAGGNEALGFDGVHPLPAGQHCIARALAPVIDSLLALPDLPPAEGAMAIDVYPQPARTASAHYITIRLVLPAGESEMRVHDSSGRLIRKIAYFIVDPGVQHLIWALDTNEGSAAHPGVYFVRVSSSNAQRHCTVVLE